MDTLHEDSHSFLPTSQVQRTRNSLNIYRHEKRFRKYVVIVKNKTCLSYLTHFLTCGSTVIDVTIIIIIIIIIIIMSCEVLGVVPVLYPSRWSWSLHLFLGRPMLLFPFGLYFSACLGILSLSILSTCCSHSRWYCFISRTMFCTQVSPLRIDFFPYLT
jgi:hypothetical protein